MYRQLTLPEGQRCCTQSRCIGSCFHFSSGAAALWSTKSYSDLGGSIEPSRKLQRASGLLVLMKPQPREAVKWSESQVFSTASLAEVKARAQSAKVKAMPDRLSPGDQVRLVGLKSSAQLNGENGTLVSYDAERKRWAVELSDGVKNVLRVNLCKCDESSLQKPQATPLRRAIGKRPMQLLSKDGSI